MSVAPTLRAETPVRHPPLSRSPIVRSARVAVGVGVAYALVAAAGLWLTAAGGVFAFSPAAGVGLAAVVRFGWHAVPGLLVAAVAVNLATVGTVWGDVATGAGEVASAVLGAWVATRNGWPRLDRVRNVGLLTVAAMVGSVPVVLVELVVLWAEGVTPRVQGAVALFLWAGEVAGALLITPSLLRPPGRRPESVDNALLTWTGLGAAVAAAVWFGLMSAMPLLSAVACLPLLVMASARYGPRGAALANLAVAVVMVTLVLGRPPHGDLFILVVFLTVSATTALCLGAVTAERDGALAELAADRARFATLLTHSHDVIAVATPDARVAFVSDGVVRLTGRTPRELVGRPAFEDVHPDDVAAVRAALEFALARPRVPTKAEFRVRRVDGRWVWVEAVGTNYTDSPAVGGVVVNLRDVTERREVETRLREARELLEVTGQLARIGGWEYDVAADRLTWSEQTFRIHEVSTAGFTPTVDAAIEFYAPEARGQIREAVERCLATGEPWDLVLPFDTARGRRLWVNARGQVERRDGKPHRLFGTFQDVTERVEAERAVQRLEQQFRQAQKMEAVARLAGGVAHDFNNLLTVINVSAELIAAEVPPDSPVRDLVSQVQGAGSRAADLTRQLLAFSRRQPPTAGLVDLVAVVANLRPLLDPLLGEDTRLVTRLESVPPVVADRGQIEQVVMNLCVNARDAMPEGGTLTVETYSADVPEGGDPDGPPPGRWVVLAVSDTGTGIPEEVRPHLFEPFYTTKELGKGTGLGLSTVYGIATTAGGFVRFDTATGWGTTFRVYFPVHDDPASIVEQAAARGGTDSGTRLGRVTPPPVGPRPVVLLAEDDRAVRGLAERVLRAAGFEVVSAADGEEALAKLATLPTPPAVLLTDVRMPKVGGRELADKVRAAHPRARVLFVSGYAPEGVLPHGPTATRSFLAKPFTGEQLVAAVRKLLPAPKN